jgi:hypothetical protein
MNRHPSVQSTRLRLEAIEDDVVCLGGGEYRAVLEVGSVSFGLQGERQQEATLASYAAFLNSLAFPVQILVRVLPINLERYLTDLERRAAHELPEQLADLARDHAAFLRRLARNRTLLERRFYLIVPAGREAVGHRRGWPLVRRAAAPDPNAARRQLTVRCEEIARQLARCELSTRRLRSVELAQLYYACWCPELARTQRLHRELTEYTALVVQADGAKERGA